MVQYFHCPAFGCRMRHSQTAYYSSTAAVSLAVLLSEVLSVSLQKFLSIHAWLTQYVSLIKKIVVRSKKKENSTHKSNFTMTNKRIISPVSNNFTLDFNL